VVSNGTSSESITISSATFQYFSLPTPAVYLNGLTYNGSSTWLDSSPNGVNATLGTGTAAKNGAGNALLLNGSTYWTFPEINLGNAWTVCIWVKNLSLNGASLLTQELGSASSIIVADPDYAYLNVIFYNSSGRVGVAGANSKQPSVTTNTWTYIQGTWDGSSLITYFNGVQYGPTQTISQVCVPGNGVYYIGRRFNGSQTVNAEVGEIRIFRSALTASQIAILYNYTKPSFT